MTPKFHPLRLAEVRRETRDAISLRFDVPAELADDYRFTQGQHLTLKATVNGEELRRSYSICSGVDDDELRVAIKRVQGGRFSNWACDALHPGDTLEVMTPEGRFHTELDPASRRHYVAFAAGSGITPILSLIRTTLKREPHSRFTLIYGNRSLASTLFAEALEDLKDRYLSRFTLYHVFSREEQDVPLFNGRIDRARVAAFLDTLLPPDTLDAAFVCGPGAMIDEVEAGLLGAGMPAERIHFERFGVPSDGAPAHHVEAGDAPQARITIVADGLRREMDFHASDPSILDVALAAGMDLPYSCKGGVCCTCRAKVVEGRVRMDKNYTLEQADVNAGYVLTCQAHPLTERVVISFDDR